MQKILLAFLCVLVFVPPTFFFARTPIGPWVSKMLLPQIAKKKFLKKIRFSGGFFFCAVIKNAKEKTAYSAQSPQRNCSHFFHESIEGSWIDNCLTHQAHPLPVRCSSVSVSFRKTKKKTTTKLRWFTKFARLFLPLFYPSHPGFSRS